MSLRTVRRHSENEPRKGWIESLALAQGPIACYCPVFREGFMLATSEAIRSEPNLRVRGNLKQVALTRC